METTFSIVDLFKRCWRIIRQEGCFKGRISRGEYFASSAIVIIFYLLLTLLLSIIIYFNKHNVVGMSIIAVIFWIINVVSFLLGVKLLLKRTYDLDKSEWRIIKMSVGSLLVTPFVWWFMSILFLLTDLGHGGVSRKTFADGSILFNLMDFNHGGKQKLFAGDLDINIKTIIDWSLGVLTLLTFLSTLYTLFVLFFKKGTDGESRFGPDPLLTQPKGDGIYWVLRLILFVVYGVLSVTLNRQSLEDAFVQGAREMGDSMILTREELGSSERFMI